MATFSTDQFMTAWNTGNVEAILEFYADDCEVIGPLPQPTRGKDQLRKNLENIFRAFSDSNADEEVVVQSGDKVAALLHITQKHTGPLDIGGKVIPATNKTVDSTLAVFLTLNSQGKILKEYDVSNQLTLFQQLGITPPIAAAGGAPVRRV
ncbi:MAG: ester cyclase [Thermoplasmatota archaeon]